MPATFPDPPGPRMAYDRDGSVGYIIDSGAIRRQINQREMEFLNNDGSVDAATDPTTIPIDGQFSENSNSYVGIVFPEPRDVVGFFISPQFDSSRPCRHFQTSTDSTNILDGTWTDRLRGAFTQSWQLVTNPYYRKNASFTYPNADTDAGIVKVTWTGVKAVRFSTAGAGGPLWITAWHIYGSRTPASNPFASYQTTILQDSPLLAWPLDDASGTVARDVSSYSRPGTYSGTPTLHAAGPAGLFATSFDGINDYVYSAVDLSRYTAVTLEAWVWWDTFANDDRFLYEYTANTDTQNGFLCNPNYATGNARTYFRTGANYEYTEWGRWTPQQWTHVVIPYVLTTYSSTWSWFQRTWLYTDNKSPDKGYSEHSSTDPGGPFDNSTVYLMSRAGASNWGKGRVAWFAIYPGVLSYDRVGAHYYAMQGTTTTTANNDRLALWDPALNQEITDGKFFNFNDLNFDATTTQTFRVKNMSSTLTANSVNVFGSDIDDGIAGIALSIQNSTGVTAKDYSQMIIDDEPALYWKFNESNGATTVADSSGSGFTGTIQRTPSPGFGQTALVTGQGTSLGLSGGDQSTCAYVQSNTEPPLPGTGDFTAELVLTSTNDRTVNAVVPLFSRYNGGGLALSIFCAGSGGYYGALQVRVGNSTYTANNGNSTTGPLFSPGTHHVAVRRENGSLTTWVDGTQEAQHYSSDDVTQAAHFKVGGEDSISSQHLTGNIGHFAYYTRALDAGAITRHAAQALRYQGTGYSSVATLGAIAPSSISNVITLRNKQDPPSNYQSTILAHSPLLAWPLDDAAGSTTARDVSGNNRTGTYNKVGLGGPGRWGACAAFNGTSSYISRALDLSALSAVTIEAWCQFLAFPGTSNTVWEHTANGSTTTGGLNHYFDTSLSRMFADHKGTNAISDRWNLWPGPPMSDWWYVAHVHDFSQSSSAEIKTYIRGLLYGTDASTGTDNPGTDKFANSTFYVGARAGTSQFTNMRMQWLAIYPTALTAAQLLSHYDNFPQNISYLKTTNWQGSPPPGLATARIIARPGSWS